MMTCAACAVEGIRDEGILSDSEVFQEHWIWLYTQTELVVERHGFFMADNGYDQITQEFLRKKNIYLYFITD